MAKMDEEKRNQGTTGEQAPNPDGNQPGEQTNKQDEQEELTWFGKICMKAKEFGNKHPVATKWIKRIGKGAAWTGTVVGAFKLGTMCAKPVEVAKEPEKIEAPEEPQSTTEQVDQPDKTDWEE